MAGSIGIFISSVFLHFVHLVATEDYRNITFHSWLVNGSKIIVCMAHILSITSIPFPYFFSTQVRDTLDPFSFPFISFLFISSLFICFLFSFLMAANIIISQNLATVDSKSPLAKNKIQAKKYTNKKKTQESHICHELYRDLIDTTFILFHTKYLAEKFPAHARRIRRSSQICP